MRSYAPSQTTFYDKWPCTTNKYFSCSDQSKMTFLARGIAAYKTTWSSLFLSFSGKGATAWTNLELKIILKYGRKRGSVWNVCRKLWRTASIWTTTWWWCGRRRSRRCWRKNKCIEKHRRRQVCLGKQNGFVLCTNPPSWISYQTSFYILQMI